MLTQKFSDGTGFVYLDSFWYGLKDTPITDNGIEPDIIVTEPKDENRGIALNKAIEFLNKN